MKNVMKKCAAALLALTMVATATPALENQNETVVYARKKKSAKSKKAIAKKYIGKPITALIRKIGRPTRSQISSSCNSAGYYEGLYQFKGFKVVTRSKTKSKKSVQIIKKVR